MKNIYLFIIYACCMMSLPAMGQDIISTDPNDAENNERSAMTNKFDWMSSSIPVYHPTAYIQGGGATSLTNPYFTIDAYLSHLNYYNFAFADRIPENLDFNPEDGWELIHKGNGFQVDEINFLPQVENRIGPYFILYNRYTGTLRTFAAFNNIGANQVMLTIMELKDSSPQNPGLKYSGLFSRYEDIINPLDEETEVIKVVQGSDATIGGQFFSSDFKVTYDPCICKNPSYLNFKFKVKNSGSIQLDGRLIGTSVPLDGTGNSPLLNGREFLSAVHMDNFSVNGGMLTYNNIDQLVDKYETPETPLFQTLAIAALKAVMKGAAKPIDDILDKASSKLLTSKFGGSSVLGIDLKDTLKVSFGAVGALTKQLSTSLFAEDKIPNISFIEAEMTLSGTLQHETSLGAGDIEIAVPGSKDTDDPVITPDRYYPAYNELLGLFAVLDKPKILSKRDIQVTPRGGGRGGGFGGFEYDINNYFKFSEQDFKFHFNPAAEVDLEKTKIFAAIELKINNPLSRLLSVSNANEVNTDGAVKTYITDFYPLESLERLTPSFYTNSTSPELVEANLRLQIFYQFKENKYGKTNQHYEILTYPMDITTVTSLPNTGGLTELPSVVTIGTTYYTSNTVIRAVDNIIVTGNISTAPGVTVELISGKDITILNNSTISPEVRMHIGLENVYGDEKLEQVKQPFIDTFCSARYLAKNSSLTGSRMANAEVVPGLETNSDPDKGFYLYPNPAQDGINLQYYLEEAGRVQIKIIDMQGKTMEVLSDDQATQGANKHYFSLPNLQQGVYILHLESPAGTEVRRFIKG